MATNEYKSYDEEELKHLHKVEVEILKDVIQLCKENNIKYYLFFGSAIGTLRHKGFVPWDDDIDVALFRDDYEKLIRILHDTRKEKYTVFEPMYQEDSLSIFSQVSLNGTKCCEIGSRDLIPRGIHIDLFPLDFAPNNISKANRRFKINEYFFHILFNYIYKIDGETFISNLIHKGLHYFLKVFPISYKKWKKINFNFVTRYNNKTDKVTVYNAVKSFIFDKDDFEPSITGEFEGVEVVLPKNVDKILTYLYGDYMVIPPVEKRVNNAPDIVDFGKY